MDCPVLLYVEDEEADVVLLRMAFRRARLSIDVKNVTDGVEAISYLLGDDPFSDRARNPFPALVLLDLNLPRKSGLEVLAWARSQPRLDSLPFVIFTSSIQGPDRARAQELRAADYIIKPSDLNEITRIAAQISRRWLSS